ncbi:MAG: VWA domain-containing protein [Thermodesulfobacteriota bacterium]
MKARLWIISVLLLLPAALLSFCSGSPLERMEQAAPAAPPPPSPEMAKTAGVPADEIAATEPVLQPLPPQGFDREAYDRIYDNPFLKVTLNPLSTFSIDVDTASYSNMRRFISQMGSLPPQDAVRIEELVNYFDYHYTPPAGPDPFSAHVALAPCPWQPRHKLLRLGLKGRVVETAQRPASNLVLLLDVSGSMDEPNKLPLLKQAMKMLVRKLNNRDRVAIVVYAGASGLVLPSTSCGPDNEGKILAALENLHAGGSTHGSAGIQQAYEVAQDNFIRGGLNRVILCTDGDFNVGVTNRGDLTRLIEEKAKSGIFLTVLGFGMYNLQDATMEQLADKGNGNYGYIDTINEARKLLVDGISATLVTIAKDVKIQIEFNPALVNAYRLIGYENRMLRAEDFHDDKKDAGEIGAGHTVTALYEIVPAGVEIDTPQVDPLKYQPAAKPSGDIGAGELMTLKLRYKMPDADTSKLLTFPVVEDQVYTDLEGADPDFKFAAAVAGFGMLLRDSAYKGEASYDLVLKLAQAGRGEDEYGYRTEFINLVRTAQELGPRTE